jgi:hypothetical protein
MAQISDTLRSRVQELQSKGSEVRLALRDGTSVRGRIARLDGESLVLRRDSAQETNIPLADVLAVSKQASGVRKAIWVPLVIGGAVLVTLCAGPYPIGFLCRSDPS